ncbi:MAG: hypothetical protein HY820_41190 [Acidobacteria bacterium]|nr:hypothetical protein [Acidobacteriota bacterium]
MKNERSEAQKNASRLNGSRSRGPSTPEGIEGCRRAATIHGMYSPQIIGPNEDPAKYERLLTNYVNEWNPIGQDERDLVTDIVNARWRIRRAWGQTTGMISTEMIVTKDAVERAFYPVTAEIRQCCCISTLEKAHPGILYRMQGCEESLKRLISRSRKELIELQTMRLGEKPRRNPQPEEDVIFFPSSNVIEFVQPDSAAGGEEIPHEPTPPPAEPESVPEAEMESGKGPENDDQSIYQNPENYQPLSRYFPTKDELQDRLDRWNDPPVDLAA